MLRNGDGHLKNYGVVYDGTRVWLSPVYDVITTTIYPYERGDGVRVVDRTMALKLRVGDRLRLYPDREALMLFGQQVCGLASPAASIEKIADAMDAALHAGDLDDRIPESMLKQMSAEWRDSISMYHLQPSRSKR
jgi:serine/threonine-protein kinase HipA